ncbi:MULTISPECIES: hypothetical protein [Oceanobacillus]|uniref:Uncharacterized protein n=1 Tax=Oceanobacillus indicireducens TaxID=1004261 RepID=A0A918CY80_9BACI|nr:hypothetical protein [Oceanobacillus indicireducens]GGN48927.1 hypothetical protein GCM10007971_01060 [Oceanobacillus indicireducens]
MVIPTKSLLNQKIEQLKNGENAFAESPELIRLLERDVAKENLNVVFDKTPAGCWIIPQREDPKNWE